MELRNKFENRKFKFNNKDYNNKSYAQTYYDLVKDVLEGAHGEFKSRKDASIALGKTVCLNYEDIPESVLKHNLYKPLHDVYVITNKDVKGFNKAIERISKKLEVEVEFN